MNKLLLSLAVIAAFLGCKKSLPVATVDAPVVAQIDYVDHAFPVKISRSYYREMLLRGKPIKNRPPKGGGTDTTTPPPTDTTTPPPTDTVIVVDPVPSAGTFTLYCPPVQNQLYDGPCNSFAACYAKDIQHYYQTGQPLIFSPEYLYNLVIDKIKAENYSYYGDINWCSFGSSLMQPLDMMVSKGVCTWASMPFKAEDCYVLPNASQLAEGYNYRIPTYYGVYTYDTAAIKTQLRSNRALVFSCSVDNSWINAGPGFIWKTRIGWGPGHGMTVVGYDDTKNAFKILNSWGTTWGDAGYGWIDYGFFMTNMSAWCFTLN